MAVDWEVHNWIENSLLIKKSLKIYLSFGLHNNNDNNNNNNETDNYHNDNNNNKHMNKLE